jgi:hypothetical protein
MHHDWIYPILPLREPNNTTEKLRILVCSQSIAPKIVTEVSDVYKTQSEKQEQPVTTTILSVLQVWNTTCFGFDQKPSSDMTEVLI